MVHLSLKKDVFNNIVKDDSPYKAPEKIGHAELERGEELLIFTCEYKKELTNRSAKKEQFEIAKKYSVPHCLDRN